jgi:hypothetical protein
MRQQLGSILVLACVGLTHATEPTATWKGQPTASGEEIAKLTRQGLALYQAGRFAEALRTLEAGLARAEARYSKEHYPQGHAQLAHSLNTLALLHYYR